MPPRTPPGRFVIPRADPGRAPIVLDIDEASELHEELGRLLREYLEGTGELDHGEA